MGNICKGFHCWCYDAPALRWWQAWAWLKRSWHRYTINRAWRRMRKRGVTYPPVRYVMPDDSALDDFLDHPMNARYAEAKINPEFYSRVSLTDPPQDSDE